MFSDSSIVLELKKIACLLKPESFFVRYGPIILSSILAILTIGQILISYIKWQIKYCKSKSLISKKRKEFVNIITVLKKLLESIIDFSKSKESILYQKRMLIALFIDDGIKESSQIKYFKGNIFEFSTEYIKFYQDSNDEYFVTFYKDTDEAFFVNAFPSIFRRIFYNILIVSRTPKVNGQILTIPVQKEVAIETINNIEIYLNMLKRISDAKSENISSPIDFVVDLPLRNNSLTDIFNETYQLNLIRYAFIIKKINLGVFVLSDYDSEELYVGKIKDLSINIVANKNKIFGSNLSFLPLGGFVGLDEDYNKIITDINTGGYDEIFTMDITKIML